MIVLEIVKMAFHHFQKHDIHNGCKIEKILVKHLVPILTDLCQNLIGSNLKKFKFNLDQARRVFDLVLEVRLWTGLCLDIISMLQPF